MTTVQELPHHAAETDVSYNNTATQSVSLKRPFADDSSTMILPLNTPGLETASISNVSSRSMGPREQFMREAEGVQQYNAATHSFSGSLKRGPQHEQQAMMP
ncbi:hypothetical protein AC579_4384 [Pseudocercospora musae]|uniref:Uncharacterized protein n=1 Tax=Pseudocercospora musae TaxID=113226 RepID=A0A139HN40_9PEZI|nr:hypothetical protein AC579_4384 [Pseudocercospora musae]